MSRHRSRSANKSRRTSSKKVLGKPSVWQAICGANERARQRVNRRAMRRKGQRSMRAAIADVSDDVLELPPIQRLARWAVALLLLPVCLVSTLALLTIGNDSYSSSGEFWINVFKTKQFLWFSVGMIWMTTWFFVRFTESLLLYLYVLGHELTHAIFVIGFLGKVSGIRVNKDGGYIITNKTNILIALSPYFVPFWAVVFLILSLIASAIWTIPYREEMIYGLLGAGWLFHLLWTIWMIPQDQPDLQENGTFFSLVFIYLANVLVLSCMLCLTIGAGAFLSYGERWLSLFKRMVQIGTELIF